MKMKCQKCISQYIKDNPDTLTIKDKDVRRILLDINIGGAITVINGNALCIRHFKEHIKQLEKEVRGVCPTGSCNGGFGCQHK